jgi:hypothetical protein
MPRDGSNIYHRPPGTDGVPNYTVESARYNAFTADVEQDLNLPRPIVAGGTGATSPDSALDNLSAEKFKQVVTNWDSNVWRAGSFYAAITASGAAPVAGHAFAGIAYYANATDFVLEATDLTDPANIRYVRVMASGVWGAWAASNVGLYVKKTGDTMTGDLTLNYAQPGLNLTKTAGNVARIVARTAALLRWAITLGDAGAESGSNAGSDYALQAYDDTGVAIAPPAITVKRALNRVLLAGDPAAALDAATKQYVDAGDTATITAIGLRGYLFGLTMSTAGASTTLSVAPGAACDSTGVRLMKLVAAMAKTTAAWAAGSAAGGLDTGAIATNTWYHWFLIFNPTTSAVDLVFSATPTPANGPTLMPAGFTLFRRIGSMKINASSQWIKFNQNGDSFLWDIPVQDAALTTTFGTTPQAITLSVPSGAVVTALFQGQYSNTVGPGGSALVYSPLGSPQAVGTPGGNWSLYNQATGQWASGQFNIQTNTLAQIMAVASGASNNQFFIITSGWADTRGRLN